MFVAQHPRNIPAAYHRWIGQLLVRWSVTELYIQSIVWHVWKVVDPKVARLLTSDLPAFSKVDLFRLLATRWVADASNRAEIKAIAAEADTLRSRRNRVAHGSWGHKPADSKTLYLIDASRDKRTLPKAQKVTPDDLKDWARQLDVLNRRLVALHRKLGAPPP